MKWQSVKTSHQIRNKKPFTQYPSATEDVSPNLPAKILPLVKEAYELYNAKIERIVNGHWNPAEEAMESPAAPPVHPLNQILYGPPGTGKTYHTRALAVAICQNKPVAEVEALGRTEVNRLYAELEQKGQIVFTTFHQSLGYEDFVEGIKPVETDGSVSYEVRAGLLKELAAKAVTTSSGRNFDQAYKDFISDLQDLEAPLELKTLKQGKVFQIRPNSAGNLTHNAKTEKAFQGSITKKVLSDYVLNGVVTDWKSYTPAVGEYFKKNYRFDQSIVGSQPHVLIMDEINRGNVSAIFGELITLIEDGKRAGQAEAITVTLPYSQEKFTLPANLFLVGTMNTADRSVEALDTALRRRFVFQEMMPNSEILNFGEQIVNILFSHMDKDWEDDSWKKIEEGIINTYPFTSHQLMFIAWEQVLKKELRAAETLEDYLRLDASQKEKVTRIIMGEFRVNLKQILDTLNARLSYLKDKNHTLGHAFFLDCTTAVSVIKVIAQKILPLLEEFFYGETAKIGMVLSKEFLFEGDERTKGADLFHTDGLRLARELDLDLGTRLPRRSLTGPELLAKVGEDEETALHLLNSILPRPTTNPA